MTNTKFYKPLDGTIFGEGYSTPLDNTKALNNNVCVFGTSGTGKTYSFIEPNILQMNSNYVIADAKGDILHDLGNILIKHGYKVSVLNLATEQYSMHYNPLAYVHSSQDIHHLATTIVPLEKDKHDMFWTKAGQQIVEALIAFVCEALPKSERNMNSVTRLYRLIQQPLSSLKNVLNDKPNSINARLYAYLADIQDDSGIVEGRDKLIGQALFKYYETLVPDSYAVRKWQSVYDVEGDADRTISNIVGMAGPYLAPLEMPWVQNILASNDFDFANLLKPKQAFFVLYSDEDPTKSFLSNIFYSQLIKFLYAAARKTGTERLPHRVRFFLDDFYNIHIPHFMNYLATARSRNIAICIILQSEAQLQAKYGYAGASQIIGNCFSYLLTGTTDLDMAEAAAKRFGKNSIDIRQASTDTFFLDVSGHLHTLKRYNWKKHPALKGMNYSPYLLRNHFKASEKNLKNAKPKVLHTLDDHFKNILSMRSNARAVQALDPIKALPRVAKPKANNLFDSQEEQDYYKFLNYLVTKLGYLIFPHISLNNLIYDRDLSFEQKVKNNLMSVDFCICTPDFEPVAAIEIDGEQHRNNANQVVNDIFKDVSLYYAGIPVFRLKASYSLDYAKATSIFKENNKEKAKTLEHKMNIMSFGDALKKMLDYKKSTDSCLLPASYIPYSSLIFYKKSDMQAVYEPKNSYAIKGLSIKQLDNIYENSQMLYITKAYNEALTESLNKQYQAMSKNEQEHFDEKASKMVISDINKAQKHSKTFAREANKRLARAEAVVIGKGGTVDLREVALNDKAINKENKDFDLKDIPDFEAVQTKNKAKYDEANKKRYAGGRLSRNDVTDARYLDVIRQAFGETVRNGAFTGYIELRPNSVGTQDAYSSDGKTCYATNNNSNGLGWQSWHLTPEFFDFICKFKDWNGFSLFNTKVEQYYDIQKKNEEES